MKATINSVKPVAFMFMLVFASLLQVQAQKVQDNKSVVQNSVDARDFVFVAQSVSPLRGGVRQLTSYYDLRIAKDTVVSNLPYFGRAYTAPVNATEGGLNFTSIASGYEMQIKKKGKREITINTKSADDTQRMLLTVFDNGAASLQVTSNNRDPISFDGYIKGNGKK